MISIDFEQSSDSAVKNYNFDEKGIINDIYYPFISYYNHIYMCK